MRSYALVIMNINDKIVDRFNLDIVTSPSDTGFSLNLSAITTDLEDVITKVVQQKNKITLSISQIKDSYTQANILADWIQKYSTSKYSMFLEYNDTKIVRYCGGKVTKLSRNERNQYNELVQNIEFTMTTPFFEKRENTITIEKASEGKNYPYKYPYKYGANLVSNNLIDNPYILDIPVIITLENAINNPYIALLDESGTEYTRVSFDDVNILQNEKLIINSAEKKIYKINANGDMIDYRPMVNPLHDTFLIANRGKSTIMINTNNAADGFKAIGGWRQYRL